MNLFFLSTWTLRVFTHNEPEFELLLTLKPGMDRNRFNFQRMNKVAAVFSATADGEIPESYITIRNKYTKKLQYVSTMDPNVEPWLYRTAFYPYGTRGWHSNLKCVTKNRCVTRAAYNKFRMGIRNKFNVFLIGRRLFQRGITQVNDQKTASNFATDSYRFWGAESRKNSQNVPSRHVFLQNLISYPYKECSDNFFLADCSLFSWPKIEVVMVN